MASDLIKVAIFGAKPFALVLPNAPSYEAGDFECKFFDDDATLAKVLTAFMPQVILTVGDVTSFKRLNVQPINVRKRWIHCNTLAEARNAATRVLAAYVSNATEVRFADQPLVSVITPTYLTGALIARPLCSLLEQTYNNWEWVIYDDSPDDGKEFSSLSSMASQDHRIVVYRSHQHSGVIGEVKRNACMLAKGSIIVELDHDDMLTENALKYVVDAFQAFPAAGFAYTDCAEVFDDGTNVSYGDRYAFGYGSYRKEVYKGKQYLVSNYPNVNAKTIRHIVGVPNHLRAWTKNAYIAAGGHSLTVHVCDDYELLVRTFLTTRMVKIPHLGYIQYHNRRTVGNTHRKRNKEIQRLVRCFRERYNDEIHARLLALGVDDYIWQKNGKLDWLVKNPEPESFANLVAN